MRTIRKGSEPPTLTAHRQKPFSDYESYEHKSDLRQVLVTEQHGLCCYCMGRIFSSPEKMKIEHWHCQSNHAEEQLDYQNLLGACLGGDGQPPHLQHCDTRKGERDLMWNPADPSHHIETRIQYGLDGSIHSDDLTFDSQLNDVLNLNIDVLKSNRKSVWIAIIEWWNLEKERLRGPVPRSRIQRERDRRIAGIADLEPYCQVAIWWLDQRLSRQSS